MSADYSSFCKPRPIHPLWSIKDDVVTPVIEESKIDELIEKLDLLLYTLGTSSTILVTGKAAIDEYEKLLRKGSLCQES